MNAGSYLISCSDNFELEVNCLFPLSSLQEGQIKAVWEFLHQKAKTLIVPAGWQTNKHPQLRVLPSYWVPVTLSFCLFSLKHEGGVGKTKVRRTCENSGPLLHKLICFDRDAEKRSPGCWASRASSVIHLVLLITGTIKSYCTTHTDLSETGR